MRRRPTLAEHALDDALSGSELAGSYRTQEVFANRILDFWFPAKGLCVEVDGGYHQTLRQQASDRKRDHNLSTVHVPTLRVTNNEVFEDPDLVVTAIAAALEAMPTRRDRLRKIQDDRLAAKRAKKAASKKQSKFQKWLNKQAELAAQRVGPMDAYIRKHMRDIRREIRSSSAPPPILGDVSKE